MMINYDHLVSVLQQICQLKYNLPGPNQFTRFTTTAKQRHPVAASHIIEALSAVSSFQCRVLGLDVKNRLDR